MKLFSAFGGAVSEAEYFKRSHDSSAPLKARGPCATRKDFAQSELKVLNLLAAKV